MNCIIKVSKYLIVLISLIGYAQKPIELKNSNIENVNPKGDFFWWQNKAINGAEAIFKAEENDVNSGSKKALRIDVVSTPDNPWFLSSIFNQEFNVKTGQKVTVKFYAKKASENEGKIKLVLSSNATKGSFQGKDFYLSNQWEPYEHQFTINTPKAFYTIKFWYLSENTTYLMDDVTVYMD